MPSEEGWEREKERKKEAHTSKMRKNSLSKILRSQPRQLGSVKKGFWHKALFLALTFPASLMSELLLFHWLSDMRAPAAKGLLRFREAADESAEWQNQRNFNCYLLFDLLFRQLTLHERLLRSQTMQGGKKERM